MRKGTQMLFRGLDVFGWEMYYPVRWWNLRFYRAGLGGSILFLYVIGSALPSGYNSISRSTAAETYKSSLHFPMSALSRPTIPPPSCPTLLP